MPPSSATISRSSSPSPSPTAPDDISISRSRSLSDDEEFRRAQEMALAVAALGSSSKPMTASDIRMAVADVIAGDENDIDDYELKQKKQLYVAAKQRQEKKAKLRRQRKEQELRIQLQEERRRKEQQRLLEEEANSPIPPVIRTMWKQLLSSVEGQVIHGQNLLVMLGIINSCIFYLAVVPPSSSLLYRIVNAVFVVNMTVVMCLTKADEATSSDDATADDDENLESELSEERVIGDDEQEEAPEQLMPLPIPKSTTRMEWLDGIHFALADLEMLETLQPESTLAERRRFLKARKFCVKAASAQLGSYLQWRETNRINEFFPTTFTTDADDWTLAARGAVEISNTSDQPASVSQMKLPRIVSIFENDDNRQSSNVVCKNGARIVHVLPCQLDSNLAALPTYALAVAMYLDRKLDRDYTEKVTVVIDIRFGQGWTNPSSVSIVPFIKLVVGLLNSYFPERLSRCILFPLPMTATMLFNTAKTYLDPDTAAKIQVCSGTGSVSAPVPSQVLSFIDQRAIDAMEERRKSFFR